MSNRYPVDAARAVLAAGIITPEEAAKDQPGLVIGPRIEPCVCGAGRHAHKGSGRRPAVNYLGAAEETGCKKYRPDLVYELVFRALDAQAKTLGQSLRAADKAERAKHYADNPRKPGEWSIGASDTTTCPRKIWYRNLPPDDLVRAYEDNSEAMAGTMLHDAITAKMERLYPWRMHKTKVRIAGLDRDSELDEFDPVTGELIDWKTAGDYRWDKLADHGPDDAVWGQAFLYGLALVAMGYRVTRITLVYYHRAKGKDESFSRPWDRAFAEKWRDILVGYATALDAGQELPRSESGPTTSELCRRCFARIHCWNLPAAAAVGRGPESYTLLGEDPDDDTIIPTIAAKVEASAARLAADKAEKEAAALLEGIEPRRYGDYQGRLQWGGGGVIWKEWAQTLEEYYTLPEDERPALETLNPPTATRRQTPRWEKVRAATLAQEEKDRAELPKESTE